MTTTTQPLYVQGMIVALVVVCVWFTFLATLGAVIWAYQGSASNGPIHQTTSSVFFWIVPLVLLDAGVNDFLVFGVVPPSCWRNILGMVIAPASNGGSTVTRVFGPPNSGLEPIPAGIGAEPVSRIFGHKRDSTFTTRFLAHMQIVARKTSKWVTHFRARPPVNSLSIKSNEKGRWPYGPATELSISSVTTGKGPKDCSYSLNFVGRFTERWMRKLSLIDSKGEIPNEAEEVSVSSEFDVLVPHRERLNKRASLWDGAIVRTIREMNRMRLAEMTSPLQVIAA